MGVTLRKKPIKNGSQQSLYLDFYPAVKNPVTGEYSRREFLGIYILTKPLNEFEKELNKEKIAKAEAVRGLREMQIINEKFDFIDKLDIPVKMTSLLRMKLTTHTRLSPSYYFQA